MADYSSSPLIGLNGTAEYAGNIVSDTSPNGSVAVGTSFEAGPVFRAAKWTDGEVESLDSTIAPAQMLGVSDDGEVSVGWAVVSGATHGVISTAGAPLEVLAHSAGVDHSLLFGTSADGSIHFGYVTKDDGIDYLIKYTAEDGIEELGDIGVTWASNDRGFEYGAVSADGTAAFINRRAGVRTAHWSIAGGLVVSWFPADTPLEGTCMTRDGSLVAGFTHDVGANNRVVSWDPSENEEELSGFTELNATLGFTETDDVYLYAISADGTCMCGEYSAGDPDWLYFPWVWTAEDGLQILQVDGVPVQGAAAVMSDDGHVIYGYTYDDNNQVRWVRVQPGAFWTGFVNCQEVIG